MVDDNIARVQRHYRDLLGPVYAWSVSGSGDPVVRAEAWLKERELLGAGEVLDLGAGFGAHAVPLARSGAQVTAVDLDSGLLEELRQRLEQESLSAQLELAELLTFLREAGERRWDRILCLGDTLTHLPDADAVAQLIRSAAQHLSPGGRLVLQWRDTSAPLPQGVDRLIPVARDRRRTMHCLIEAIDEDRMRVTDLVTEVTSQGPRTRFGEYQKLRLASDAVADVSLRAGFSLEHEGAQGGFVEHRYRFAR